MQWLNIETKTRTAPEFIGSSPVERATWLCLMLYCSEHETGGCIPNCREWKDRRLQQTLGITKEEVELDCDLWFFDESDLFVWGYPLEKEDEVRSKRHAGRKGGRRSASSRASKSGSNGKERKGIEKEEESPMEESTGYLNNIILNRPEQGRILKLKEHGDFMRHDVISIACTIVEETTGPGMGWFCKQVKGLAGRKTDAKACDIMREELFMFWSEIKAGEEPASRGAALTARIKKLMSKHGGVVK